MERSIVTLKRLFSKDIKTEQNNVMQNICVFRVILFCFVICTSMAILNISRIFIVDHKIMTWGYMGICVVSILYFVLILLLGIERTCIPYISITTISQLYSIYISCDHPSHISYRSCKHVWWNAAQKICILADCILYCGQHLCRLLLGNLWRQYGTDHLYLL